MGTREHCQMQHRLYAPLDRGVGELARCFVRARFALQFHHQSADDLHLCYLYSKFDLHGLLGF